MSFPHRPGRRPGQTPPVSAPAIRSAAEATPTRASAKPKGSKRRAAILIRRNEVPHRSDRKASAAYAAMKPRGWERVSYGRVRLEFTRNGAPVFELTPHRPRKGLRLEAIEEFKRKRGIETIVAFIADDFDDPMLEDFLLRPLPPDA